MGLPTYSRALAGVALAALAVSTAPSLAQTRKPVAQASVPPAPVTSPIPIQTPRPAVTTPPTTTSSQPPSALPGAVGTPAPATRGATTNVSPTGGTVIAPAPVLVPADQTSPLPYPAYGTPAPTSPPHTAPGIPQTVTLQQAILIAYARSPLLATARAQVEIATAPVSLAESALFPAVTGTASTTRDHRQTGATTTGVPGLTGAAGAPSWFTSNSLSATLTQLIFDGGRVAAQIRAARATQSASIATYQRQLQTIAFNVATAYYNTLSAQRLTQVGLATVQIDQVQENLVAAQIRAGTAARTDLATAQLPTAQARVAVVRAQAAERVQLATFANTLGLDAAMNVQPKDDIPALTATSGTLSVTPAFPTPSYDQAYTRAVALRPDLLSAQQNVASFQASLRAARLGNFPSITGNGSYGTASSDVSGSTFRNTSSIGLALSVPIYDRGVTRAQTMQVQGQLDQSVAQLVTAQQSIQLNVRTTLVNLIAAYAALDQTNAELAKAQEVLRATEAQYRSGVTTLPLLLNAQVGITTALTDEVNAVYAVRQAEQALLFAEGANAAG